MYIYIYIFHQTDIYIYDMYIYVYIYMYIYICTHTHILHITVTYRIYVLYVYFPAARVYDTDRFTHLSIIQNQWGDTRITTSPKILLNQSGKPMMNLNHGGIPGFASPREETHNPTNNSPRVIKRSHGRWLRLF